MHPDSIHSCHDFCSLEPEVRIYNLSENESRVAGLGITALNFGRLRRVFSL